MKDIIIVGAGGFGRELLQWIKDINRHKPQWRVKGFIDDNMQALDCFDCSHAIIGTIKDWTPSNNQVYVCGIAKPSIKEQTVALLKERGAFFESVLHPTAVIGEHNNIGEGLVAYPFSCITVNVKVGNFVTLLSSEIGHDAVIGDFCTISSFCDITTGVQLGQRVFLGSHSTIIPNKKIGDDAYVGAGSVVVTHVKEKTTVMGNPAMKLSFR